MKPVFRHLIALAVMMFGCAGVMALVYYMNELSQPPPPAPKKVAKAFEVEKQPKQEPKVKKKTQKPKKAARNLQAAPMPNISSAMSGLSFDLPQFSNDDLMGSSELLSQAAGDKKLVMTGDSVDTLPQPRSRKAPEYPAKARERGIEGVVVLKIRVSERGEVEQVRVLESDPPGVFDSEAIAAVNQWTFFPATYEGQPVAVSVSQRIPFRLN